MDDVDLALRGYWIHAFNILEEEVVPYKPTFSQRLHRA